MAQTIDIALIQFQPKDVDVEANYAYCEAAIRAAAADGTQLAVLPEYHLTSWCPEHPDFVAACIRSSTFQARYEALARETDISIVPGTIVEVYQRANVDGGFVLVRDVDDAVNDEGTLELRNMACFIAGGTGAVLERYQKTNLWRTERAYLTAPAAAEAAVAMNFVGWPPHRAFDTPWMVADGKGTGTCRPLRAGLLVCWDLAFPEAFRALVADGADLIVVPCFWDTDPAAVAVQGEGIADAACLAYNPACEAVFVRAALVARACENCVAVAFCNAGGLSQLAQPLVGPQGELPAGVARTQRVTMDMDVLRAAEGNYRVRADMLEAGWHYAYTLVVPKAGEKVPTAIEGVQEGRESSGKR